MLTVAACALSLVPAHSPATYGYDDSRSTADSTVDAKTEIAPELGELFPLNASGRDGIVYDDRSHFAHPAASLVGYRSGPNTADDLVRFDPERASRQIAGQNRVP